MVMFQSVLTPIVPYLAVFWMVVGGLVFAFVLAFSAGVYLLKKPVKLRGTREQADPALVLKNVIMLGSVSAAFVLAGMWLYWSDNDPLKTEALVWASLIGALLAGSIILRRSFR